MRRDARRPTFSGTGVDARAFPRVVPRLPLQVLTARAEEIAGVAGQFVDHRFDVLGSGWLCVRHDMEPPGWEGRRYSPRLPRPDSTGAWLDQEVNTANVPAARRIWAILDQPYCAIDWHRDIKSGYRWAPFAPATRIRVGHLPGVDVKVPWELGRLQHLPHLAVAYTCACAGVTGFDLPERYAREFRNQVIDFVATNPPRFGVNWASTMDVAIRAANVAIADDLFRASGAHWDEAFGRVLGDSLWDHATHVVRHLEWNGELRGNHYLANLAGLLVATAYLPESATTDGWAAFAVRELLAELDLQFLPDGGNFEGSVAYHRLSSEIALFGTAFAGLIPAERAARLGSGRFKAPEVSAPGAGDAPALTRNGTLVPDGAYEQLAAMRTFALACQAPGDRMWMVGDNDSGRFVKLASPYLKLSRGEALSRYRNLEALAPESVPGIYWDEAGLSVASLVSGIDGLLGVARAEPASAGALEHSWFAGFRQLPASPPGRNAAAQAFGTPARAATRALGDPQLLHRAEWVAWTDGLTNCRPLSDGLTWVAFPHFGVYIARAERLFLGIRCGPPGQRGWGGHTHNDQLAVELAINGCPVLVDPGTYVYTGLPGLRNRYRSVHAHNGPWACDREPARLTEGLFRLGDPPTGVCHQWGDVTFVGSVCARGVTVRRELRIEPHCIRVIDSATAPLRDVAGCRPPAVAPGYGRRLADGTLL